MPALHNSGLSSLSNSHNHLLARTAGVYGIVPPRHYSHAQPYNTVVLASPVATPNGTFVLLSDLISKISLVQDAGICKSSQRKDASRLQNFLLFCEGLGIKKCYALPAREDVIIAWASTFAGHFAGCTVGAKILALKKEHDRLNLVWLGGDHLRRILKGIEELHPASSSHSKRAPVTIPMLHDLNRGLSRLSGLDICVQAVCFMAFFCQLCTGEILPPSQDISKFNSLHHATFNDIAESTASNGACNLHLPWSKTQKARGDDVWIPQQEAPLDPIHSIHKHFIKNNLHLSQPIASYRDTNNNLVTLTRSKFICRVNAILQVSNKNYSRITGHCFHIGGTTFYLISGVLPDVVKKFGRWHSHAFLEYWQCLDYLGAMHINMLPLNPALACLPKA